MYPWEILEIEPTNSKKAVKNAYAVLIKKHRPDSEPERFQAINHAYKTALNLIENDQEINPPIQHSEAKSPVVEFSTIDAVPDDISNELAQDILNRFDDLAAAGLKHQNKDKNWKFLEKYHLIEDFQVREALSIELFKRVGDYNRQSIKQTRTLMLGHFAIETMAYQLDWENNWQILQQAFPEHHVEQVFKFLSHKQHKVGFKQLFLRVVTVPVDVLFALGITYLISLRPWASGEESLELLTIVVYMVLNLSTIDMTNSLSLLQTFLGFKAFDKNLIVISSKAAVKRAVTFHMTMTPWYFILFDHTTFFVLMLPVIGVMVVINLLIWLWRKQLIHDWVSGTFVLK